MVVAVNTAAQPVTVEVPVAGSGAYLDVLNPAREYRSAHGCLRIERLDPTWGCILRRSR